jgi:hypothetical protein
MSERVKLAREIAARSKPRFISIPREPKSEPSVLAADLPRNRLERARVLAQRNASRFIESPRERCDGTKQARRGRPHG